MKTITLELDDAIVDRIDEVVAIRKQIGEPTTPETLAARWLSDYVGQRLPVDLVRFRGLEDRRR
jgi:hypothetical protein